MKKSNHKHEYEKIILHYLGDTFAWGRECRICGRIDSTFKSSNWNTDDFKISGENKYGEWEKICLSEIHEKYPDYKIMKLGKDGVWEEVCVFT